VKRKRDKAWTPFRDVTDVLRKHKPSYFVCGGDRVFINSRYEVTVYYLGEHEDQRCHDGALWLSIKRRDRVWMRDWRELQRIKNEVAGPEREACEVFPAESRLVDSSNQYHLWVLPTGERFPFGYQERLVMETTTGMKCKQRQFEPDNRPSDLTTAEEEIEACRDMLLEKCGGNVAEAEALLATMRDRSFDG
jgi:hypothetical protein